MAPRKYTPWVSIAQRGEQKKRKERKGKKKVMGAASSFSSFCSPFCDPFCDKKTSSHSKNPRNPKLLQQFRAGTMQKRILYIDIGINWNNPLETLRNAVDAGYNVVLMCFYLNNGPTDMLLAWASMTEGQKAEAFAYAAARNAIIGFSAGGSTETPYILNPDNYAETLAQYAQREGMQIVDCDFEGIQPGFTYPGVDLYEWFRRFNTTLLTLLGGSALVSHTPQMPYAAPPNTPSSWPGAGGGYYTVYQNNSDISWIVFQMYNQQSYTTYAQAFVQAPSNFPGSSLGQVNNSGMGIPWTKLVFGTYLQSRDASNGVHDPIVLRQWFDQAQTQLGYDGSVMVWQYRIDGSPLPAQFLQQLYG
jgi:hypothetical protein